MPEWQFFVALLLPRSARSGAKRGAHLEVVPRLPAVVAQTMQWQVNQGQAGADKDRKGVDCGMVPCFSPLVVAPSHTNGSSMSLNPLDTSLRGLPCPTTEGSEVRQWRSMGDRVAEISSVGSASATPLPHYRLLQTASGHVLAVQEGDWVHGTSPMRPQPVS
jgi:hypothetical protein